MLRKYRNKFVCMKCGAVHWYSPREGCQKCGHKFLKNEKEDGMPKGHTNNGLNLDIDPLKLDQEWIDHPKNFHVCAEDMADCQLVFDTSKSRLDVLQAEIDRDIRADPEHFNLPIKLTEKMISNTIILQEVYRKATRQMNIARHEFEIAKVGVTALEHKKRALTLLVELWIRDYYSDPKIRPATKESEDWEKRTTRSHRSRRVEENDD